MTNLRRSGHPLGVVVQTLASSCWSYKRIDREMRVRLTDALSALQAHAVVARFFRESVALCYSVPSAQLSPEKLSDLIVELDGQAPFWIDGAADNNKLPRYNGEVVVWPVFEEHGRGRVGQRPQLRGYLGVWLRQQHNDAISNHFISTEVRSCASVIFQVLQERARLYLPFARKMAERYWADAMRPEASGLATEPARLELPWTETNRPVETVSLGFDLRRSTFCMESAVDPVRFADWLDQLVQILMRVGHEYGGIFDKFTGDGGLVHFLHDACNDVYNRSAIDAAVRCAISMQRAVAIHIERLREFLRLDSSLLGGAIGIDTAIAHWDLDHRQNPITVGRGVVAACRLMARAPAYAVRVTNIVYRQLDKDTRSAFRSIPFESKEYPAEMEISVWEIKNALAMNWIDDIDVQEVCDAVYGEAAENAARARMAD
jgi:class 3 adenylate cyclase